jgi:mono/diheme cytochrome c family protein
MFWVESRSAMGTRKKFAAAFAAGFVAALALYFLVSALHRPAWRSYQEEYAARVEKEGKPPPDAGPVSTGRSGDGKVERCLTCHLGMVYPESYESPFQAHPKTRCAMGVVEIGCTHCHRGEGLALTMEGAHGLEPRSRYPLLDWKAGEAAAFRLQAGCARCHGGRPGGVLGYDEGIVPDVAAGMDIFLGRGCTSCHCITGVYCAAENGPNLTGAALGKSFDGLEALLRSPQASFPDSPMPPFSGTDRDLERLALFLLAQTDLAGDMGSGEAQKLLSLTKTVSLADHFGGEFPAAPAASRGRVLVGKIGCLGCHRAGEESSGVPDLAYAGWTRGRDFLENMLKAPGKEVPGTYMPALDAPQAVVDSIVEHLYYERAVLPTHPETAYARICAPCHGADRDPGIVVLAKAPPLLVPGGGVPDRDTFMQTLSKGRKGTAMAPWARAFLKAFVEGIYGFLNGS